MEWKFTVVGVNVVLKLSCLHQPCCLSAALNVSCLKKSSWSQSKFAVVVVVVVVIVCALVCGRGLVGRICILCLCYIHIHITCIYVCIYRYIHTHHTHTHQRARARERGREKESQRERERETATAAQNSPVESERSFSSPPAQTGLECIFHAHVFRKKCRLAFASDEFATSHKIFTEIIV